MALQEILLNRIYSSTQYAHRLLLLRERHLHPSGRKAHVTGTAWNNSRATWNVRVRLCYCETSHSCDDHYTQTFRASKALEYTRSNPEHLHLLSPHHDSQAQQGHEISRIPSLGYISSSTSFLNPIIRTNKNQLVYANSTLNTQPRSTPLET
ncbi:hypothetical protein T440DRAFT_242900 [Plenodomus tracheiphilus IPT5]|uniref:Uncharacterized protein n=1 Tax=Plenodomus tracheiphilus IPT5 TaxID=1408161 RepID=A0A6A7BH77_9PLEO|nr:hypothetical protein T440DRAFT_242900 [Plenodomus tracheiphilus IPT5]